MKKFLCWCVVIIVLCGSYSVKAELPLQKSAKPDTAIRDFQRAQVLESLKRFDEAQKIYERLFETDPSDRNFWKLLLLYEKTNNFTSMAQLVLKRLQTNPEDATSMRYLARAYYGLGDVKKARSTLLNIIGDRWNDIYRIYQAANEFTYQNDFDSALDIYAKARKKMGNKDTFNVEIARIYTIRLNYEKAIEEYLKTLDRVKVLYPALEQIINKAFEAGITVETISRPLKRHLERFPGSIQAARLLSNVEYRSGNYEDAAETLMEAAIVSNNPQDIWNIAERLKKEGHMEIALKVYEAYYRYFEKAPGRVSALLESASIKTSLGDKKGAVKDYERLVNDYPGTDGASIASLRIIELSQDDMSEEGYIGVLLDFAGSTKSREAAFEAYITLGDTFLKHGQTEKAKNAFKQAKIKSRQKQDYYEVAVRTSMLDFFTGDYKSMSEDIETVVKFKPNGDETNDLLSLQILGMRCSSEPDIRGFNTFAHGKYALYRGEINTAVDSFMTAARDTVSIVAPHAAGALAEMFAREGDMEKAFEWYMHAASTARDTTFHVSVLIGAADIAVNELHDSNQAKNLYLEAITAYQGTVYESELRRKLRKVVSE